MCVMCVPGTRGGQERASFSKNWAYGQLSAVMPVLGITPGLCGRTISAPYSNLPVQTKSLLVIPFFNILFVSMNPTVWQTC